MGWNDRMQDETKYDQLLAYTQWLERRITELEKHLPVKMKPTKTEEQCAEH